MMIRNKKLIWSAASVLVVGLAITAFATFSHGKTEVIVPTARVQRGSVDLNVIASGELRTTKSAMIVAPPINGTLQIVSLAKPGTFVKAGDVVLEFDPAEQEYNLEQAQSRLNEAEQQIIKAKADAAVQAAQDKVTLLRTRFDVRRAELEVGKNELVGEIDAQKNNLALKEAKRRLAQVEQDVASRRASNDAGVAVLQQTREQARLQMMQAQQNIENMQVKAPIDGIFSIQENADTDMLGGMGGSLPEYREGDQVYPGRAIAQVLDLGSLELSAKVSELDRVNLKPGAAVDVVIDLAPGRHYAGKVKTVAGLAARTGLFSVDSGSKFETVFELDNPDGKLRPGASAEITVRGAAIPKALNLPRECVFQKDGKPVVYLRVGNGFKSHDLRILSQTESRVVIDGLAEGTEVAIVDPTATPQKSASAKSSGAGAQL